MPVRVFFTVLAGRAPDPLSENFGKIIAVIDSNIGCNLLNLHVRCGQFPGSSISMEKYKQYSMNILEEFFRETPQKDISEKYFRETQGNHTHYKYNRAGAE